MRALLIDNYDSFTYNLFQLLAEVTGRDPIVVHNDAASWDELARLDFDAVVLSPGPGRPQRGADFGVCAEAIARCERPLLGVCLGHQGIGIACGAQLVPAPEPLHGRLGTVVHGGSPLFAGIPERFEAVRYHSLCLRRPLPAGLEEVAVAEDGVAMAIARRDRPQWGVQFHPESVATEHGRLLLGNFRDLALAAASPPRRPPADTRSTPRSPPPAAPGMAGGLELSWRSMPRPPSPEDAFTALYGDGRDAFWLDGEGDFPGARFSYMGDAGGPLAASVAYDLDGGELRLRRGSQAAERDGEGREEVREETVFEYLARELAALDGLGAELPFDFRCGFAGYLGYELKAECGGERAHASPLPDAALIFADRMLAFDRGEGTLYLLCLHRKGGEAEAEAEAWLGDTEAALRAMPRGGPAADDRPAALAPSVPGPAARLTRSRQRYLEEIAECKRLLREGETYEVCLTNSLELELDVDPLDLYRQLRRRNPAPHSAYLRLGELAVLSSSPERFLRIDREGGVEAKPIKGTSRRAVEPDEDAALSRRLASDPKNRAENLMIADLMRNDLGSVCEVGSVHVPALMAIETYATVHQLVTTVRGRLRADLGPLDAVRACFPPGSMTGAPKRRTMEILDRLEGAARGPYSGALGYFGPDGTADLSVVIRSVVLGRAGARIGAGGAIVAQSDPEAEFEEMLLKAAAVGVGDEERGR